MAAGNPTSVVMPLTFEIIVDCRAPPAARPTPAGASEQVKAVLRLADGNFEPIREAAMLEPLEEGDDVPLVVARVVDRTEVVGLVRCRGEHHVGGEELGAEAPDAAEGERPAAGRVLAQPDQDALAVDRVQRRAEGERAGE